MQKLIIETDKDKFLETVNEYLKDGWFATDTIQVVEVLGIAMFVIIIEQELKRSGWPGQKEV